VIASFEPSRCCGARSRRRRRLGAARQRRASPPIRFGPHPALGGRQAPLWTVLPLRLLRRRGAGAPRQLGPRGLSLRQSQEQGAGPFSKRVAGLN